MMHQKRLCLAIPVYGGRSPLSCDHLQVALELVRFWFEFETPEPPQRWVPRVGVTAWTVDDARLMVSERLLGGRELPHVIALIENVDVSTLDENHVVPNMDPPNERGIWYPRGY